MIDPKVAHQWPEPYRTMWLAARFARVMRRGTKHLGRRGGRWREWLEHGEPVG